MLQESQQHRLYKEWIGAETRALFFAEKSSASLAIQRRITGASLALSSFAVVTLAARLDPIVPAALSVITAILSAYSLVAQHQKKAVDAADLHSKWNRLSMEYARLWDKWYTDEAGTTLDSLEEKSVEISKSSVSFPNDETAMRKWELHVLHEHGHKVEEVAA